MKMSTRQWLYGSECHQFLNETEFVLLVYLSWIRHSSGSTQIGCCDAFFYDNCQWTDLLLLHRSHDAGRGLMLPLFPKRQSASYACAVAALSLFCLWIIFVEYSICRTRSFFLRRRRCLNIFCLVWIALTLCHLFVFGSAVTMKSLSSGLGAVRASDALFRTLLPREMDVDFFLFGFR